MTESEFAEQIEAVCLRPKMYTPNGTFFENYCFLDGLGIGALENRSSHSAFTPFRNWLAEPDEHGRRFPISLEEFRSRFSSDDEALREFASLYRQYVQSKQ
ncbi:MAG: hypothetical protein ABL984_13795 [Pyrinomonadaceae bacterium]